MSKVLLSPLPPWPALCNPHSHFPIMPPLPRLTKHVVIHGSTLDHISAKSSCVPPWEAQSTGRHGELQAVTYVYDNMKSFVAFYYGRATLLGKPSPEHIISHRQTTLYLRNAYFSRHWVVSNFLLLQKICRYFRELSFGENKALHISDRENTHWKGTAAVAVLSYFYTHHGTADPLWWVKNLCHPGSTILRHVDLPLSYLYKTSSSLKKFKISQVLPSFMIVWISVSFTL